MEYRYWYHEPQLSAALNFVKQLQAEARRLATSYIHARDKYLHAIRICYQFGFEETAHELFCELSMMATRHGLFNDALQYARKCGPTYPKGYLAEAFACESLCRNHLGGSLYLDSCFISYARYVQVTKDHDAFIQAMKLATDFDVPLNKALMDSARDSVCKIVQKLIQKEWCTAKYLLALLSMDTNAATQASLTLSRVLYLKELNPNILRDLIKNGIKVVADDFEDAISVLSDDNVDLIKVLTSEVEGSPDYVGLWYQTIRDKPVLARHFFMCWAHPDTKNELGSMYGSIAEKCNPYERTSLFTKALETGDGDFADQLLSGGSIIGSEINLCLLLSYLAQPVFTLSVASSILTHLQKQGVSFEGTSNSSLKPIECILMDEKSDTLKKASFLTVLLKNGYSIDALELKSIQSTAIHEITKICLETGDVGLLQLACSKCTFPENGKVINNQGQSPLHLAAKAEYCEASKEICRTLSKHINPHIADKGGNTALHLISKTKKMQKKKGPSRNDERCNILFKAQQASGFQISQTKECTNNEKLSHNIASSNTTVLAQDCSTSDCGFQQENDPLDIHIDRLKAKEPLYFILTPEPTEHSISKKTKCHVNEEGSITVDTQGTSADRPQDEVDVIQHLNPRDDFADTRGMAADGPQDEANVNQIGDDQCDFNGLPWEVECTENVLKFLKSEHPLKYKVVETIRHIAKGDFSITHCKKVRSVLKLYEAKVTKAVRILWEVAVQFSPRYTGQGNSSHIFSEVIRVWNVVLDHDDIDHNIRMIEKSHADGQNAAIKIMLHSTAQEECKTHNRDRMPRTFTLEDKGNTPFVPCTRLQPTEHNVITFYSLSSATVKCVLTGDKIRRDFPFKVWHKEHDIINQPYGETATVLLGRSGTGKTTCCLYRLWNQFHSYWIENCIQNPVLTRGLIPSISVQPETVESTNAGADSIANLDTCEIYNSASTNSQSHPQLEHLHQVFVTKNPILCAQMKKRFYDLAAGSEYCKLHVPFEDYCIPTCLEGIEDLAYPLFITAHEFYNILDNSLGKTFFPRFEDGILKVKVLSSEYDQDNDETILDLDDSDNDDEDLDLDDEHVVDQTKLQSPTKQSLTEISSLYFVEYIWPEIRNKSSSPHAKTLDPLLVWMEIKSTIKGSVQAMKNDKGYLSLEEYEVVGKKMAPNFVGNRADIYELFEYYQDYIKQKRYNNLFDGCDLLHSLHQRLNGLKDLQWSIHHFYIDEVQDFTQAELALFVRTCRDPNGLFLTGDSAQSIMRGVAFRFSDVRAIFYEMQKLTSNREDVTQVCVPPISHLTINFRSHTGILNLASSVIDLLKNYFPSSFDTLDGDQGMFVGPMPVLFHTCDASDLALLLRGNKREKSQIEFGAHQAIIVQSEDAKSKMPEELQGAIVLTVFESKGLEFDDVLLYNFFHDSVVEKEWRVVSAYLEYKSNLVQNKEAIFQQPRPLEFNERQHKSLNSELKYLYTAITRAKCNLWIYDCNEHKRLPMFDYWLRRNLVKVVTLNDSVTEEETLFNHTSDPNEWRKRGDYFREKNLWEPAMKCYHKAGEKHLEMEAKGILFLKKVQSSNGDELHKLYYMAALAFLDSDEAKHDPRKEHILLAAKCLKNAKNYRKAAELYQLLGKHDLALKAYTKAKDYNNCVKILEMQKRYKEAIHLLINNNCRLESIEKITEYRSNGIILDNFPPASQIAEQSVEHYMNDKPKLKMILEHITSKTKKIAYYKKCGCYQEACDILLQQRKHHLAFRLLKAQQMYDHGIKTALELKSWKESKLCIIQKAIFTECANIEEVRDLLNEQDCNIQGKACYLLGLKCKDVELSRNAFKCYLKLGDLCGMAECFQLYTSLCHNHDDEFFVLFIQACNSVQKFHNSIVSKTRTPAEGRILTVMEQLYQLESSSSVYYFPKGQDVFKVHFEDLSKHCDSDGMLELQMDAAHSQIDTHLATMRSSWMTAFQELVLSKLSEYDFHNDLVGCGYLSHPYDLDAAHMKRYIELCCLALEIDPNLKIVLINIYLPNVSIRLPFSKEHLKVIRQSQCVVNALCAEANSILAKPDLDPNDWLVGTRVLCTAGKGADCLKNRQHLSIEVKKHFDLWINHFNIMGQECQVTNAISMLLQQFFTDKFVRDDRLLVGNILSIAIVHSTALMAMWNSISKKAMPVPSIFEQHVHIFDALRPYHDNKCLFKACEEEINSQHRHIQTLKEKIIQLLWHYLDMMVGFNLYKQFCILDRTVQNKDCITMGEAEMSLILTLTLAANLSLIESNTINLVEYWKAIHCQIQPLLCCDTKLLSDAACIFATATNTTQVYSALVTLIDSFNVKPSGLLQLKLTSRTFLQCSEYPERQLIVVYDQPIEPKMSIFPVDQSTAISEVSCSQMPIEKQKPNRIQHSEQENQETDTKNTPNPQLINIPPLLDNAILKPDISTQLLSATEATATKNIPSSLTISNLSHQSSLIQLYEPADLVSSSPILSGSSDPNESLDTSSSYDPTPSPQLFEPGISHSTPELVDDPFVDEAFCGICGESIIPIEVFMDATMTENKYREKHIQSSQHSERRNQYQLFLKHKDDQCCTELKEKVKLQSISKDKNAYNATILDAESAIKDYEQILVSTQQTYDWRTGDNELRKVTQIMKDINSKMNENLQEAQQETGFQIDESNQKIDEEVDIEEKIDIPGIIPVKQHKKRGKKKRTGHET